MLLRAITAFLALPGVVAFTLPIVIGISTQRPMRYVALAATVLTLGTLVLLSCVREFYVAGRGTLAPWSRPRHLVTSGPYRWSRNPMYIGALTILLGWCVLWDSRTLRVYTLVVAGLFCLRVLAVEEPWAARNFGADWESYRAKVPRWIGTPGFAGSGRASRVRLAVIAFLAGAAAALLALSVAFRTAPGVILADDMVSALVAASERPLLRFPSGAVVYVKSAVGPLVLDTLKPRYPALNLRPYAERPADNCAERDPPSAPCERDDFLKLEVLSAPTRGTLLVAVGTSSTFGQVLLVSVLGRWHVFIERWYAV
jgi:protein-S-isoprenylcysteine O-methyltransferase Ste14